MFFLDIQCPVCGKTCGNGGTGNVFRCQCGHVGDGGLSEADIKLIKGFYQRHLKKNKGNSQMGDKVCVANLNRQCGEECE